MSGHCFLTPPRLLARMILFVIVPITLIVAVPTVGAALPSSVFAGPCPGDPPPPPQCGNQSCPTLPSTGGGGGPCEDDPADPACQGGTKVPRILVVSSRADTLKAGTRPVLGERDANTIALQPWIAAHPCPGDPPAGGNEPAPAPPPPPPIPVCAACEAPGVADSVQLPDVTVRMNPETGLVNLPTWFWGEGYRGQDLVASRSWSAPYEPTTIEVRYFVKRYIWNFGDGGQIESKSLGQAYPASSEIANTYGWSSRTEPGGVFHPGLAIEWNVEYRVNGGAPQALPPVTRSYPAIYPVQELQPIITNP